MCGSAPIGCSRVTVTAARHGTDSPAAGRLSPTALPDHLSPTPDGPRSEKESHVFTARKGRRRPAGIVIAIAVSLAGILMAGFAALAGPASAAARAAAPTAPGVAGGYAHTCAIDAGGALSCWGANYSGQLGDGTMTNRSTPVRVGDAAWAAIDAGTSYTCAVRTDGTLWCWG